MCKHVDCSTSSVTNIGRSTEEQNHILVFADAWCIGVYVRVSTIHTSEQSHDDIFTYRALDSLGWDNSDVGDHERGCFAIRSNRKRFLCCAIELQTTAYNQVSIGDKLVNGWAVNERLHRSSKSRELPRRAWRCSAVVPESIEAPLVDEPLRIPPFGRLRSTPRPSSVDPDRSMLRGSHRPVSPDTRSMALVRRGDTVLPPFCIRALLRVVCQELIALELHPFYGSCMDFDIRSFVNVEICRDSCGKRPVAELAVGRRELRVTPPYRSSPTRSSSFSSRRSTSSRR